MKGVEAVQKLDRLGYRFELAGDRLRYEYTGPGKPDADTVRPLLESVKANKRAVLAYLSKPAPPEGILTCADCDFHKYIGPNPRQGWGHCALRARGCYGIRAACEAAKCEF
jgi:hypothetical protein